MIAVGTSALMAIVLNDPTADACTALEAVNKVLIVAEEYSCPLLYVGDDFSKPIQTHIESVL